MMRISFPITDETNQELEEVAQKLGWPDDATMIGFVVFRPTEDEYLHTVSYQDGIASRTWGKIRKLSDIAQIAKIFKDEKRAEREAKRCGANTVVGSLIDTGDGIVTTWSCSCCTPTTSPYSFLRALFRKK
ncbi:MAG: hypothetical protein ABW072_01560 [Sedimenticola sp.]